MMTNTDDISNFALRIGFVCGHLSNPDTIQYLEDHGTTAAEVAAAFNALVKVAEAFYRPDKTNQPK